MLTEGKPIYLLSTFRGHRNGRFVKSLKPRLHDAIYQLRFYSNSLIHILSLSNSHSNVVSLQKNRGNKLHRVILALESLPTFGCVYEKVFRLY